MVREGATKKRRDDRWETLKRRVQLLSRLDGAVLLLASGVHVVTPRRVLDATKFVTRLHGYGVVDLGLFEETFASDRPPFLVTRDVLAAAQRDLRALATPPALAMARERRRALTRYGVIDDAWLNKKRARVEGLAAALAVSVPRAPSEWFGSVVDVVRFMHGASSASALDEARVRLTSLGKERRQLALARVDALVLALETGAPPAEADLLPLVTRLERARELPGRARRARVLDVLRRALAWPAVPAEAVSTLAAPLRGASFSAAVREAGRAAVRALPAARDPEIRHNTLVMLAFYGLTFRVGDDGVPLLSSEDVDRAIAKQLAALEILPSNVTLAQALALVELPFTKYPRKRIAEWVSEGLELELVTQACSDGHAEGLARAPNLRAARAYATWATRLVPHYRALGITFELSPELFTHLPRNEDVAVLAVCLMEQVRMGRAEAKPVADPIAVLDATLGMFEKLPAKASGILSRLKGTSPGAGRRAFPELAAWLGDEALLDRFVHLARISGQPAALGKQLREDFEHAGKAARERAHLASLAARSARQQARLSTLSATERTLASAPRGRTMRRLRERIDELLPLAYRSELDAAFRDIIRDAWGLAVPSLTQAWRDAVRFWLVVDDNRDLLGRLLREASAAPGKDVTLAFAHNRTWLAKVHSKLDVRAWLAPRRSELDIEGASYVVTLEEDPLEVLRMGIPFGTCLALDSGCNAASTVLNAVDANKRVVYVRGPGGKIVARKLVALTKDHRLVGYNLYVSMRGPGERAIRAAVEAMCRTLAAEVGAPLAGAGEPEQIHQGFWYDDGTVPWGDDGDITSYCRSLELSVPPKWFDALATEARGRSAIDEGNVESALAVLTRWDDGPANTALGRWVVERLGEREAIKRSHEESALAPAILRALASTGESGMVRALAVSTRVDEYSAANALPRLVAAFPRSAKLAAALAETAARAERVLPTSGDHGLVHATMDALDELLDGVAASFDALDRADSAWASLTERETRCEPCRKGAWSRCIAAVVRAYYARPDPEAVTACMMSRHRSELSQRAALAIAARHVLPHGARALGRLAALRPGVRRSAAMLAAHLRQERLTSITPALADKLPRPDVSPFEELGDTLLTCEGIEHVLAPWPSFGEELADTWSPGPWELSYVRRHPESRVHEALFTIAARTPGIATRAMELLASLGDLKRIEELRRRADAEPRARTRRLGGGVSARNAPPRVAPKVWKTTSECHAAAQAASVQIAASRAGTLPAGGIERKDVIDRGLVGIAVSKLSDETTPREQRELALDVVAAFAHADMRWDDLLAALVAQGDAAGLCRVLDDELQASAHALRPELVVELWQIDGARQALAKALARGADEDWAARVTACERRAEQDERDVDGLFELVALAIVELGAEGVAAETETEDQLRRVIREAVTRATPLRAVTLYEDLLDDLSASIFVRAVRRLPRDRAAALRDAAVKLRFLGERGAARKAWLLATRPLKKRRGSSIEPQ